MITNSLLGVASVNPTDGQRWNQGYNASARECAVQIELEDACDPAVVALVGTLTSMPTSYKVVPYAIRGFLRRSVFCSEADDRAWFIGAFGAAMEYAIGRSLVIDPIAGGETWIGATGAQNAATITAARTLWYSTVVSPNGHPIMHVPPSLAPGLVTTGVLAVMPDKVLSIFGDPVVINAGYEKTTPQVFFTGDLVIRHTGVDDEGGVLHRARTNDQVIVLNELAAMDVAPCSIVRVGA